ncbi:MAG: adenine phosphoribosyltransferase [Bdellovibrionales bacterium]|nr:adenine phosphoribosyltransferase [Bdellovibrionales bacterium]
MKLSVEQIHSLIRDVPDFPKPGILFKDITPVLSDAAAFASLADHLAERIPAGTTKLASIESRGFLLGAAVAMRRGLGLVLIRKPGKLPYSTFSHSYDLEYGRDTLQIHVDALSNEDRVCIVDDVLATGGTAAAAEVLCTETGATVTGSVFLLELGFLNGRQKLKSSADALIRL